MQQSNVIFAYLLIAYLIFITMRGEIPIYLTLLRGGGQIPAGAGGGGGNSANDIANNLISQGAGALQDNAQAFLNGLSPSNTTDLFNSVEQAPDSLGNDANLLSIIGG